MLDKEKLITDLYTAPQDLYGITSVVKIYCESQKAIEEIIKLQPLVKQMEHLSDIINVRLCVLLDGKDPDDENFEKILN